jgi:hypothetical protein
MTDGAPWRFHPPVRPGGVPLAAAFEVAGRAHLVLLPPARAAREVLERAGLLAWARQPAPRPDPLALDELPARCALARDLVWRGRVERDPGSGRFDATLADLYEAALGTEPLHVLRWTAIVLDIFAHCAALDTERAAAGDA